MNTIYENEIIENKMTDLLNSRLDARALMTVDASLAENAGLRKVINRYTYNGKMEKLEKGAKNTQKGTVSFVPEYYDVKRYQQTFEYNDMDAMADPYIVDVAMQGAVTEIANEINEEYIAELLKISNVCLYEKSVTYSDFVDALATIDCEIDNDLFIIMGGESRKEIRKDPEFMTAKQGEIIYSGQFGTVCGVPVIFSKLIPEGVIIITNKNAVRFFVKKDASVEQARDIETKDNTVVYERHGLIALVDDTSSIILAKGVDTFDMEIVYEGGGTFNVTLAKEDDYNENKYYYAATVMNEAPSWKEGTVIDPSEWTIIEISSSSLYMPEEVSVPDKGFVCIGEVDHATNTLVRVKVAEYENNNG